MRKNLLLTFGLCLFAMAAMAQTFVSTTPENRTVVLEEFTGINCGFCPDGHRIADAIKASNPQKTILINIHTGGFSTPAAGQPDFRTPFGSALASTFGVGGYPSGMINRFTFSGQSNAALSRTVWSARANSMRTVPSPSNVGAKTTYDEVTRLLTVEVEVYYTDNSLSSTNNINVALLESNVIGYQSDYTNGTQQNYNHKHILTDVTQQSKFTKKETITLSYGR